MEALARRGCAEEDSCQIEKNASGVKKICLCRKKNPSGVKKNCLRLKKNSSGVEKKLSLSVSKKTRLELKKKSNATKRDRIRRSLITYEVIPEWFWHECSAVVCRGRCVFMVEYTDITHELIH